MRIIYQKHDTNLLQNEHPKANAWFQQSIPFLHDGAVSCADNFLLDMFRVFFYTLVI